MKQSELHKSPYHGTNNRKRTLGRLKAIQKVQSIPIYELAEKIAGVPKITSDPDFYYPYKFLGFKYIQH